MTEYLLVVSPLLAVAWGLHFLWRRRVEAELSEGAAAEYERLVLMDQKAARATTTAARLDDRAPDDPELAAFRASPLARLVGQKPLMTGVSPEGFAPVFARTERPRFPTYALAAATIFAVGTPIVLGLLNVGSMMIERSAEVDYGRTAARLQSGEGGFSVARSMDLTQLQYVLEGFAGFYYFFGLALFWIATVALVMRRYYRRMPGSLREEVLRAR